jgi:ubiquitin-conjugating enzyme E2 M
MLKKQLDNRIMTLKKDKEERQSTGKGQTTPADIRLQTDLGDLDLDATSTTMRFPDKENLRNFTIILRPVEGYYKGGEFVFDINVPSSYPHEPPKVLCTTRVFHPNIDEEGKVCLNILRAEWKPVLTIKAVLFGLELLFIEPNPEDPLNKAAAKVLREDKRAFQQTVSRYMRGQY